MMFCPKCGSLLKIKKEKNKKFFSCTCGYASRDLGNAQIKESVEKKDKDIEVIHSEDETLPVTDAECEKCGHSKAYFWMVQTRAGDEADTRFYKCVQCKHTWRDYS